MTTERELLSESRVLTSNVLSGPLQRTPGLLGAEVIKIENPTDGDPAGNRDASWG
jgi:crotonobetainyl-CoA:carnitine CoA-transferase CaiB-like acyl-CoA transferase